MRDRKTDTFGNVKTLIFTAEGRGTLLASSGSRPGMLLNIPQCTGQAPQTKNDQTDLNVTTAEVEKSFSNLIILPIFSLLEH